MVVALPLRDLRVVVVVLVPMGRCIVICDSLTRLFVLPSEINKAYYESIILQTTTIGPFMYFSKLYIDWLFTSAE